MNEPFISVGILSAKQIEFTLPEYYQTWGSYCNGVVTRSRFVKGEQSVAYENGKILWDGQAYESLRFEPLNPEEDAFELKDVVIGRSFHWERKENQRFPHILKFVVEEEKLTAVNLVPLETYLTSVISSEMNANASLELLKAHAVISRSWLLAGRQKREWDKYRKEPEKKEEERQETSNGQESPKLRWFERDVHTLYDVCADDHCQRYQGITRASNERVRQAVADTRGEVLMTAWKEICDARFSKCCGGALEEFQYCWDNTPRLYLLKRRDCRDESLPLPDLRREEEAERWIRSTPEAFCHTDNPTILAQVLNSYDQETPDFYRWRVTYTARELSELVKERSGIDYGRITDLVPVARGTSGRLWQLKIVGTLQTRIIGKELEIRRTLSPTHLYSSAFVVDKEEPDADGLPGRFTLTGAGWGHGVGLCQIGAAVMGEQGYGYREILSHYYHNTLVERLYE